MFTLARLPPLLLKGASESVEKRINMFEENEKSMKSPFLYDIHDGTPLQESRVTAGAANCRTRGLDPIRQTTLR